MFGTVVRQYALFRIAHRSHHGIVTTAQHRPLSFAHTKPMLNKQPLMTSGEEASSSDIIYTVVSTVDVYALSRISNYMQRAITNERGAEGAAPIKLASAFSSATRCSDGYVEVSLTLPVTIMPGEQEEVGRNASQADVGLSQQHCIRVRGQGPDEKSAKLACCRHAELCLDATGTPLYTSARRQEEWASQAAKEGRAAPLLDGSSFAQQMLPPPVRYEPAPKHNAAGLSDTRGAASPGNAPPSPSPLRQLHHSASSHQHYRRRPPRRFEQYHCRYGPNPFLLDVSAQLAELHHTIVRHNTLGMEEGDECGEDGGQLATPVPIEPHEVAILQPSDAQPRTQQNAVPNPRSGCMLAYQGRTMLIGYAAPSLRTGHRLLEDEGGVFELVETDGDVWCWDPALPGPECLRDPNASSRLDHYFRRTRGAVFADCVELSQSMEPTVAFVPPKGWVTEEREWYTASVLLSEMTADHMPPVMAVGKAATSRRYAVDLCAMHAELLLGAAGLTVPETVDGQIAYYDAALSWGRCIAPVPLSKDENAESLRQLVLPKPRKEWLVAKGHRRRFSPLSITEKLLALNRRIIHMFRQHLMEVDMSASPLYNEVAELAVTCLRIFMVTQKHPYEAAYFNFVYQVDSQYRCSVYLPLPERYGLRGALALAPSPQRARQLCALHAVDVLCALQYIPEECARHPSWQRMLAMREKGGFILAPSSQDTGCNTTPPVNIRSPPAYREVSSGTGCSTLPPPIDVWRAMLLDADAFDVCPPFIDQVKRGTTESELPIICLSQARRMAMLCLAYHANWTEKDVWAHMHHYCGFQHARGRQRHVSANTFWLELPLNPKQYGKHVACGRCITRKGGMFMLYLHVLRVLHTLRATPWDLLNGSSLLVKVYNGDSKHMCADIVLWKRLRDTVITVSYAGMPQDTAAASTIAVNNGENANSEIRSPHPLMSAKLAQLTF